MDKIKKYILSVMKDELKGSGPFILAKFLSFLSFFYAAVIFQVSMAYRTGLWRSRRVGIPVISVGNITLGGAGKTPFTITLAEHFISANKQPGILIRGYGDDEHKMIAWRVPKAKVIVGRDRVSNAIEAKKAGVDVLIMDDGFQHRKLARDMDIVLLNARDPFGNGRLFPRGILREGKESLKRADIVILNKLDGVRTEDVEKILLEVRTISRSAKIFKAEYSPDSMSDFFGNKHPLQSMRGKKAVIVSGIADPLYFSDMLGALGLDILGKWTFLDHHDYISRDITLITRDAAERGADHIITTEKDYAKLKDMDNREFRLRLLVLNIRMSITAESEVFFNGLDSVVSG
ncbi:MAG: tetraacyldisaccharide 4'-kinase [Candidatus Omnitrophica bacterium]|nr:tetraacyldisaccharide 4'-kinase [Candidatus Omnitrophota bacterium]